MPTVLITGAASGIGRDTARLFASAGWQCVLVDHNGPALQAVGDSLPTSGGAAHLLRITDLTDTDQVASLREGTPTLDAIVNNAGMSDTSNTPLVAQAPAQMARLLALNLAAPAAVVQACAPLLRPGARIVNVASGAGLRAIPWRGAYSPSKAGLIAQTQALARAHPEWCVTVLCPGFVRTELVDALIQAGRLNPEGAVSRIPLGRMAEPHEMANALFFLASPGAAPLSGQALSVDGGSSVYGGSQPLPAMQLGVQPWDTPLRLEVVGGDATPWQAIGHASASGPHHSACLDVSAHHAAPGTLLQAVQSAATRFAKRHTQQASLTLLLPAETPTDWPAAGDHAAARMLVSTLACEWGSRALRINALVVPADVTPLALHPLLRYVCGASAQFLTGQTIACGRPRFGATA